MFFKQRNFNAAIVAVHMHHQIIAWEWDCLIHYAATAIRNTLCSYLLLFAICNSLVKFVRVKLFIFSFWVLCHNFPAVMTKYSVNNMNRQVFLVWSLCCHQYLAELIMKRPILSPGKSQLHFYVLEQTEIRKSSKTKVKIISFTEPAEAAYSSKPGG